MPKDDDNPRLRQWRLWRKKRSPRKKVARKKTDALQKQWTWGHLNTLQPVNRWTPEAKLTIPQPTTKILGCVYYSMRDLKQARDLHIVRRAVDVYGLASLTKQSVYRMTQIALNELARLGVIRRVKHIKNKQHAERYARIRHQSH